MQPPSLTGSILVANPKMEDPHFRHSVVYMARHSQAEGAWGFILNRPTPHNLGMAFGDKVPAELSRVRIYRGGPVQPTSINCVALRWSNHAGGVIIKANLSYEEAVNQMKRGRAVRAYAGHSGWVAGQLEQELAHHSWIIGAASHRIIQPEDGEEMWHDVVDTLRPQLSLIYDIPKDLTAN
jgi:putative transcriptional regulator